LRSVDYHPIQDVGGQFALELYQDVGARIEVAGGVLLHDGLGVQNVGASTACDDVSDFEALTVLSTDQQTGNLSTGLNLHGLGQHGVCILRAGTTAQLENIVVNVIAAPPPPAGPPPPARPPSPPPHPPRIRAESSTTATMQEAVVVTGQLDPVLVTQRVEDIAALAGLNASDIAFQLIDLGTQVDGRRLQVVAAGLNTSECEGDVRILSYSFTGNTDDYDAIARFQQALRDGAGSVPPLQNATVCLPREAPETTVAAPPPSPPFVEPPLGLAWWIWAMVSGLAAIALALCIFAIYRYYVRSSYTYKTKRKRGGAKKLAAAAGLVAGTEQAFLLAPGEGAVRVQGKGSNVRLSRMSGADEQLFARLV
jgi:hypothetical protein